MLYPTEKFAQLPYNRTQSIDIITAEISGPAILRNNDHDSSEMLKPTFRFRKLTIEGDLKAKGFSSTNNRNLA